MKVKGLSYWAKVQSPDTTFEPCWSVDLVVDKETAKALTKEGCKVKVASEQKTGKGEPRYPDAPQGYGVVKFKQKQFDSKGREMRKPKVVDASKNPFDGLVGNGSTVNLLISKREWEWKGRKGVSFDLRGVQVLSLVEFEGNGGGDDEDFDEEDGFVNKSSTVEQQEEDFDDDDNPFGE